MAGARVIWALRAFWLFVAYAHGYLDLPISAWPQWRRRRRLFNSREAVPLSSWAEACGGNPEWDRELVRWVLRAIGMLVVDPRRVRPQDRFDRELAMPPTLTHPQDFWTALGDIMTEERATPPGWQAPDMRGRSVAEVMDFLNLYWAKYPRLANPRAG